MKTDVSREAAATLAAVNAVLDDVPHWADPEFLAWERGQVDDAADALKTTDGLLFTSYEPGPHHWITGNDAGLEVEDTIRISPMIDLYEEHPWCMCEIGDEAGAVPTFRRQMTRRTADYPPPGETTHGPLLLGPEPVVGPIADGTRALYAGDAEALVQRYRTENGGDR